MQRAKKPKYKLTFEQRSVIFSHNDDDNNNNDKTKWMVIIDDGLIGNGW